MVKSGLEFILKSESPFRAAAAQSIKICPERLNWPGRLVGISEWAEIQNKNSRSLFTKIFKSKILLPRLEILVRLKNEFYLEF